MKVCFQPNGLSRSCPLLKIRSVVSVRWVVTPTAIRFLAIASCIEATQSSSAAVMPALRPTCSIWLKSRWMSSGVQVK